MRYKARYNIAVFVVIEDNKPNPIQQTKVILTKVFCINNQSSGPFRFNILKSDDFFFFFFNWQSYKVVKRQSTSKISLIPPLHVRSKLIVQNQTSSLLTSLFLCLVPRTTGSVFAHKLNSIIFYQNKKKLHFFSQKHISNFSFKILIP